MYKILFIFTIIFTCLFKTSYANEKIAFINIDRIINQSNFGKKIYTKLDSDYAKEDKKLKKIEKNLISQEKEILKQKNILSKDELNNKITVLRKEIDDFKKKRKTINDKFTKKKLDETNKMVDKLNAILSKYADDNKISLIVQKKYIVIGKSELDITKSVLEIFNKEVK